MKLLLIQRDNRHNISVSQGRQLLANEEGKNIKLITLPMPSIENPPIKSADADPTALLFSVSIALTEIEISDFMPFDLGRECTKCSGE